MRAERLAVATLFFLNGAVLASFSPARVSGVTVQSEESVTRDFGGSWFYALR